MSEIVKNIDKRALVWTVGVHALLLLLFIFWSFSLPNSVNFLTESGGFEVNIGTSEDGSGDDQPLEIDDPAARSMAAAYQQAMQEQDDAADNEIIESGHEEDVEISRPVRNTPERAHVRPTANTNTARTTNKVQTSSVAANTVTTKVQKAKYEYEGENGTGGNKARENRAGSSEGNTSGSGDRGKPGGTEGATNYTGNPGNGKGGISHNLKGRTITKFPNKEADYGKGGVVEVRVTVNKQGNVTETSIKTSSNPGLNAIARQKARELQFTASKDAPEEQFGIITFKFTTVR